MEKHSAILLAGGDKAMLEIYGERLLEIVFYKLRGVFKKIFVVVDNYEQQAAVSRLVDEDVVVDLYKGTSMLGGALTGFKSCKSQYAFLTKCSMPLLNKKVIAQIISKEGYNAVVPQHPNGKTEPLHTLYKVKPAASAFQKAINDEQWDFRDALKYMDNLYFMPTDEFKENDPKLYSFFKVNSEVDYLLAQERLKKKEFKGRLKKAELLESRIVKEMETANTVYYKVPGTEEDHEVTYHKRKNTWKCDCRHFSMKCTYCSHILAAQKRHGVKNVS